MRSASLTIQGCWSLSLALVLLLMGAAPLEAGRIRLTSGEINTDKAPQWHAPQLRAGQSRSVAARRPLLVQFRGPVQSEWVERLQALGAQLHFYLPDYAYYATLDTSLVDSLRQWPEVAWIGELPAALKASPALSGRLRSAGAETVVAATILAVGPDAGNYLQKKGRRLRSTKITGLRWTDHRSTLTLAEIDTLSRMPGVFRIEPQPDYELHGERAAQAAAGNLNGPQTLPTGPGYLAWLTGHGLSGGSGLVAEVADDGQDRGIDSNAPGTAHPDVLGRIVGIYNATDDATGDGVGGHGALNAGIILGNATVGTTDGSGYRLGQGLAPQAGLYATKIFKNSGGFDLGTDSFSSLARRAQNAGVSISNNSWGAPVNGVYNADSAAYDALVRDADSTEAGNQPITYVFSAGNSGPSAGTMGSPGTAKNVITVGAGENSDADGTDGCATGPSDADSVRDLGDFSSRGPTVDGRIGVTLVAVGTHVQGPASFTPDYDGNGVCDQYWPAAQTDYARSSGTSHSTPVVVGAGLVIRELFRDYLSSFGHPADPSPALLKAVLIATARDMVGGSDGDGGSLPNVPNPKTGWGAVDLGNLLDEKDNLFSYDQETVLDNSGEVWERVVTVADTGKPVKIVLCWTDPPAAPGANPTLINNLDLEVEGGGDLYRGNQFLGGFSVSGGAADTLHNEEAVFIQNPSETVLIRVRAANLPGDGVPGTGDSTDQDFAVFAWNASGQDSRGNVRFDSDAYNCSATVEVRLNDFDLKGSGSATVNLSSDRLDAETLTLTEIGGVGEFVATIVLADAEPVADDGTLQVNAGGTIQVSYSDDNDGSGSPAVATDTATLDCTPPIIQDVEISELSLDGFRMELKTDTLSEITLHLGTTPGGDSIQADSPTETEHSINVSGLTDNTAYYIWIEATDPTGNVATDTNAGRYYLAVTKKITGALLEDDFEPAPEAGWTMQVLEGVSNWAVATSSGYERSSTNAYFFMPANDDINDARLVSPSFQGGGRASFWHTYETEPTYDGGVLEISVEGGAWQDLGDAIIQGGYTDIISDFFESPIGGRLAWSGGTLGAMSQVQVDLDDYEGAVRLGFRFASDSSIASVAWYLDDLLVEGLEDGDYPLYIASDPVAQTKPDGGFARFEVEALGPDPLAYQWYFEGSPLSDDARVQGAQSESLHIEPLEFSDAGDYFCRVSAGGDNMDSTAAALTVVPQPSAARGDWTLYDR